MRSSTGIDLSNEGLSYLDARDAEVAGVPSLILRIGFVGELGYELHFRARTASTSGTRSSRRARTSASGRSVSSRSGFLRLEKMHILIGQDTDSESNVLEASMPWIAKLDKDDFVGKWSLEHVQERGLQELLVGFEMEDGKVPLEGAQVVLEGTPPDRADHELALEPRAAQGDRDGLGARRDRRGGQVVPRHR
jgi:sarcosine oxidase subunit alpha